MKFGPVESFIVQLSLPALAAGLFWSRYFLHQALWLRSKHKALPKWLNHVLTLIRSGEEMDAFYDRMPAINER